MTGPRALPHPPGPRTPLPTVTPLTRAPAPRSPATVPVASVQGTLALELDDCPGSPATPELTVVRPTTDPEVRDLRCWAATFAQAVVEVTGGDRPLQQLLRWTSAGVYQELGRRVQIMAQTRSAGQRRGTIRPQVRSVHVFRPDSRTAEVSVHVRYGERSRAMAARLERGPRRHWTCTALTLG